VTTFQDLLNEGTRRLAGGDTSSPRLDAEVLLRFLAGIDRSRLFVLLPETAPDDLAAPYRQAVARRLAGEPVAYITGHREFMGQAFRVAPGVLIPRPETELLVEWALETLARMESPRVVDAGTGSGAIAVSLTALAKFPLEIVATDVSAEALLVANSNRHDLLDDERRTWLAFRQGSLLEPVTEPVDLVLANLPYLTPEQIAGNPELEAEPRLALDGGSDGLDLVRALVADLPRVLAPGGGVGLEIDPLQARVVTAMLRTLYPDRTVRTIVDLAGHIRHIVLDPERG
jgi:release factor glutamine methyltransferase